MSYWFEFQPGMGHWCFEVALFMMQWRDPGMRKQDSSGLLGSAFHLGFLYGHLIMDFDWKL